MSPTPEGVPDEPATGVVPSIFTARRTTSPPPVPPGGVPAWLRAGVVGLGCCLLLALGGLLIEHLRPSLFSSLRARPPGASAKGPTTGASHRPTTSSSRPRSTTTSPPPSEGGAHLSALSPSSGAPGSKVTVTGSGLMSSNGRILVYFGAMEAPTDCPSVSRCVATVPGRPPGAATVMVTVHTASGVSNALRFSYR